MKMQDVDFKLKMAETDHQKELVAIQETLT